MRVQPRNRIRENCTAGSARGVPGNRHSYRRGQDGQLVPFKEQVEERFQHWLAQQANQGRQFSPEQLEWLRLIRDHIAASMQIDMEDFDYVPLVD